MSYYGKPNFLNIAFQMAAIYKVLSSVARIIEVCWKQDY